MEGAPITNPKDWLEMLLIEDREATQAWFNGLDAGKQQQLIGCFGGSDVFRARGAATLWMSA